MAFHEVTGRVTSMRTIGDPLHSVRVTIDNNCHLRIHDNSELVKSLNSMNLPVNPWIYDSAVYLEFKSKLTNSLRNGDRLTVRYDDGGVIVDIKMKV